MYRHILVPLDARPDQQLAVHHAFQLSRTLGGHVTLLRLIDHGTPEERSAAQQQLSSLSKGARRPPRLVVQQFSETLQELATYVKDRHVDLIVLPVSGHGGINDDAITALALQLARLTEVNVQLTAATARTPSSRWASFHSAAS
ncbi:universal stress protein [Deinococcus yavapaiensis]|uniref:Nucleotide-binding universal stress UspA family protein n=1 Tax=Deinococcus yavapaiensis KR-236 TaxID=694435 RepID=A0A318S187_9DEIO|nr:universal stress protein [Deinococcus yavapaiensis]PYE50996.1 nucleotide-binding universal stress UspA family protein [Deinococcus yavapaiensis KR-236]